MALTALLQPVGFPNLEALLAHAGKSGWWTYQVGNHSPQTVLLTLGDTVPPTGIRLGRLWMHTSVIPASPFGFAVFVPSRFITARTGPALTLADARLAGLSFIEIIGRKETPELSSALALSNQDFAGRATRDFSQPLIAEIAFPKLDGNDKDSSYMTIHIEGITYTSGPPGAKRYIIETRNLKLAAATTATAKVTLLRSA